MEIDVLYRQGKSIRAIVRETGIARNTVRSVLRGLSTSGYSPRVARPTKLDNYKSYLVDRQSKAGKFCLPATVLLREIQALGYDGGITQLKDFLHDIRPVTVLEPVKRFETPPAKQLQIDFVVFRRGKSPLRAFTSELGYSRYAYVEFTNNERCETLISCLERAFEYFGGTPEDILCDNPKTIVIQRDAYGDGLHRYNKLLLDFCKHYGVRIKLCAPYRAQTKGKVERFHRYLRESFFNPLQTMHSNLVDVSLANREVLAWLNDVANCRTHATLRERPDERFAAERLSLAALPLPFGGQNESNTRSTLPIVPTPVESIQHPLSIYEMLAREIAA